MICTFGPATESSPSANLCSLWEAPGSVFVYYLAAWLELMVTGSHIGWFVPFNILLNGCIAYTVYRFGKRLSGRWLMGFLCGILYLLSRMSYYQISQVYGLMESMALWTAIGIFYCLYRYVSDEEERRWFLPAAIAMYFSICFIHERYMVLLPLFYAAFLMKKEKRKKPWLSITGVVSGRSGHALPYHW